MLTLDNTITSKPVAAAPVKVDPPATSAPVSASDTPAITRMIFLRHEVGAGWFARFFGFPGHGGRELGLPVTGGLADALAYLRERNPTTFDSCWLTITPVT